MTSLPRTVAALSYADRRALLNAVRDVLKRPGRLALWAFYALVIVGFVWAKTAPRQPSSAAFLVVALNDLWMCGFAFAFGAMLAGGSARWLGVFSSRTEALFLTRAHESPLVVAAYLQLRAVVVTLVRGFARFAYLIVVGVPSGSTAFALAAQLCFFAAAAAAIASIALPRALAHGAARTLMIVCGLLVCVAAAVPLLVDGLQLLPVSAAVQRLTHIPGAHPGFVLRAIGAGDLRAIGLALAVAVVASGAFVVVARDAYPELYEISLANLEWRAARPSRRLRAGAAAGRLRGRAVRSAAGSLARGALALVWADALMFSRRISPAVSAFVAVLALCGGAAFAVFSRHNPELAFGILIGTLPGLTIAVASTAGVRLAPSLRMPLFWLGSVPFAARLGAWTFASFWRDALFAGLAVTGYAALTGEIEGALVVFAGAVALLALTRAAGVAVFALIPNQLDQRGPAVMMRSALSLWLIAPAAITGVVAAMFFAAPFLLAVVIGSASAFAESALLIVFAARRLAGRVDQLAVA